MQGTQEIQVVREIRDEVSARVRSAGAIIESVVSQVTGARSDTRLSLEGRQGEVDRIMAETRPRVEEQISNSELAKNVGIQRAGLRISELTRVSPEDRALRVPVLAPVLSGALERPEVLLNAYGRRFDNLADRILLEECAEVVIDALAGSDGGVFAEQWNALQRELSSRRPHEEQEAVA